MAKTEGDGVGAEGKRDTKRLMEGERDKEGEIEKDRSEGGREREWEIDGVRIKERGKRGTDRQR